MRHGVRIVATAPVPAAADRAFADLGTIDVATDDRSLRAAEVLLVRGTRVSSTTIESARALRVIARTGAGYDGVDVAAATRRGIPILYAPGAGTVPLAEGTFALILAATKRLNELAAVVRTGAWDARYAIETVDLRGATLGIVGLGSIGREVARLARAFGMAVIAHDPHVTGAVRHAELVSLSELVARADVISMHCALTESTRGLVDRELLRATKPGAILVNVARGGIIESETLLLEALEQGWLSAVALDVYADEPPDPAHPLFSHPRVVGTPHCVGLSAQWNASVFGVLAHGVAQVLRGDRPSNVVNPEALERASAATA